MEMVRKETIHMPRFCSWFKAEAVCSIRRVCSWITKQKESYFGAGSWRPEGFRRKRKLIGAKNKNMDFNYSNCLL